jgi:hypothetical protein
MLSLLLYYKENVIYRRCALEIDVSIRLVQRLCEGHSPSFADALSVP